MQTIWERPGSHNYHPLLAKSEVWPTPGSNSSTNESDVTLENPPFKHSSGRRTERLRSILFLSLVLHVTTLLLFAWNVRQNAQAFSLRCIQSLMMPSPAVEAIAGTSHVLRFEAAFNQTTPWRGPPSDEIDQNWENIMDSRMMLLSYSQAQDLGLNPIAYAQVPPKLENKYGPGIMAGNEFSHQLHCLNLMRKYISLDYYSAKPREISFNATSKILETHLLHCIDILRQALMCQPDTGLYPLYWMEGRPIPMPDFSTKRKCRNFDNLLQWAHDHAITESLEVNQPGPNDIIWSRQDIPSSMGQ